MPSFIGTPRLISAWLALVLATAARTQTAPAPATDPAVAPVVDPAKAAASVAAEAASHAPKHERVMSDSVAATLADGRPHYSPPPKLPEPKPEDEQTDLRDTDKPKNKIIRLQKYIVKEPKPPVFRDRDLESKDTLADRALKAHAGLGIGNIFGLNRPTALLMYEEQERLNNMADLKKDSKDARNSGDSGAADYISRESNRANYRPSDFGWNSDTPAGK